MKNVKRKKRMLGVFCTCMLLLLGMFSAVYAATDFQDVEDGSYYHDAVEWALKNDIVEGMTEATFAPDGVCTRAQIVTILWRVAGSPICDVEDKVFIDVPENCFYHDAVYWAWENNITLGTDNSYFSPEDPCTRGQAVTLLWRMNGSSAVTNVNNPFMDIQDGYYKNAVLWAIEEGITNGISENKFAPDDVCTRAQIVTLVYRARLSENVPEVDDIPEVQYFPSVAFSEMGQYMNAENPYSMPFTGLYEMSVTVKNAEESMRSLKVYIPETVEYGDRSVFLAIPDGVSAEVFIEASGWRAMAEEYQFFLFVAEPENNKWQSVEEEMDYIAAAFSTAKGRRYTGQHNTCYYFVGYGVGGTLVQRFALENPTYAAGMAVIEGGAISKEYLEEVGAKKASDSMDPTRTLSEIELPVWLIQEKEDLNLQNLCEYWVVANHCTDEQYMQGDTTVWFESPISSVSQINGQLLGRVQKTIQDVNYYDQEMNEKIWSDFLGKTMREATMGVDSLRPYVTREEAGLQTRTYTQSYNGKTISRRWYVYVPERLQESEEEIPVVFALHAYFGRFDIYTDWNRVAEERGFIVVYPVSYPRVQAYTLPVPEWNLAYGDAHVDDIEYLRDILVVLKSEYSINSGKVYATGQSNGSAMVYRIGLSMSDVVTAIAPVCATIIPGYHDKVYSVPDIRTEKIPVLISMGENDMSGGGSISANKGAADTLKHMLDRNGFNTGNVEELIASPDYTQKNGIYNNQYWVNDEGIPLVRYTIVEGKGHVYTPADAWMVWDDFMSRYTRAENGSILYMQDEIMK